MLSMPMLWGGNFTPGNIGRIILTLGIQGKTQNFIL